MNEQGDSRGAVASIDFFSNGYVFFPFGDQAQVPESGGQEPGDANLPVPVVYFPG